MKKIIFRNPFISKKDREKAKEYMEISSMLARQADAFLEDDPAYAAGLTRRASIFMKYSAKLLGFRNTTDMLVYKNRHRKI